MVATSQNNQGNFVFQARRLFFFPFLNVSLGHGFHFNEEMGVFSGIPTLSQTSWEMKLSSLARAFTEHRQNKATHGVAALMISGEIPVG